MENEHQVHDQYPHKHSETMSNKCTIFISRELGAIYNQKQKKPQSLTY
jgi:hypothetical protein